MNKSTSIPNNKFNSERRKKIQIRKMNILIFIRDGIERRLAAINASIDTLNNQIERDSSE